LTLLFLGCSQAPLGSESPDTEKEEPVLSLSSPQSIAPQMKEDIKEEVRTSLLPYRGIKYSSVNITAVKEGGGYRLEVAATSRLSPYQDTYTFFYEPSEEKVLLTGYLLEALPGGTRERAVRTALRHEEVRNLLGSESFNPGEPAVRRILPETAKKFYAPKQLFSVTWADFEAQQSVSALVAIQEGKVVQTWRGSGQGESAG